MKATPSTIFLSGEIDRGYEGLAVAAIRPGMLINIRDAKPTDGPLTVPGRAKDVGPHNVAGGTANPMFAREMDLVGSNIDDLYEIGDTVLYQTARAGDRIYALVAAGQDIAAGAKLESAGNGYLRAQTPGSQSATTPFAAVFPGVAVAVALEDVDNDPGTGGAPARIKIEVL